jgi:hypothetical protein
MGKFFKTDEQRAAAYAAMKQLERMLEQDGELPPGFYQDVTGVTVEVKLPKGCVVERDKGTNGDGTVFKRAVQNLYGYAVWCLMIERLKKFHQWNVIRGIIIDAIREALRRPSTSVRREISEIDEEMGREIEKLQQEFPIPPRIEKTPRVCKNIGHFATVTFRRKIK